MKYISYHNEWNHHIYKIDDVEINSSLENAKAIKEIFIDDNWYPIIWKKVNVPYHYTGHRYYADSIHAFVQQIIFKIEHSFDLGEVMDQRHLKKN